LEKLGIIVKLASEKNIDQVLNELKEYFFFFPIDSIFKKKN